MILHQDELQYRFLEPYVEIVKFLKLHLFNAETLQLLKTFVGKEILVFPLNTIIVVIKECEDDHYEFIVEFN